MDTDSMATGPVDMPSTLQYMNWTWSDKCSSASKTLSPTGTDVQSPRSICQVHERQGRGPSHVIITHMLLFHHLIITTYLCASLALWTGSSSASGRNIFWLLLIPLTENPTLSTAFSTGTQLVDHTPTVSNPSLPTALWLRAEIMPRTRPEPVVM